MVAIFASKQPIRGLVVHELLGDGIEPKRAIHAATQIGEVRQTGAQVGRRHVRVQCLATCHRVHEVLEMRSKSGAGNHWRLVDSLLAFRIEPTTNTPFAQNEPASRADEFISVVESIRRVAAPQRGGKKLLGLLAMGLTGLVVLAGVRPTRQGLALR